MSTPKVGITTKTASEEWFNRWVKNYWVAMEKAGCQPVLLAPQITAEPAKAMDALDGLLLSGGGDIAPHYYGRPADGTNCQTVDEARDALELSLFVSARAADKPILGICRGFQVVNVAMGGTIRQDFPGHSSETHPGRLHAVEVLPHSRLADIIGFSGEMAANTYHHQGVTAENLAPGMQASAWAVPDRWLIEGIEAKDSHWLIAVQWHPERYVMDDLPRPHVRLFESFCRAMRAH